MSDMPLCEYSRKKDIVVFSAPTNDVEQFCTLIKCKYSESGTLSTEIPYMCPKCGKIRCAFIMRITDTDGRSHLEARFAEHRLPSGSRTGTALPSRNIKCYVFDAETQKWTVKEPEIVEKPVKLLKEKVVRVARETRQARTSVKLTNDDRLLLDMLRSQLTSLNTTEPTEDTEIPQRIALPLSTIESQVETVETAAETVETAAETVETAAETVETAAETVETAAETVETAAETVETAAETVETAAETVETAAETVETAAEVETVAPSRHGKKNRRR